MITTHRSPRRIYVQSLFQLSLLFLSISSSEAWAKNVPIDRLGAYPESTYSNQELLDRLEGATAGIKDETERLIRSRLANWLSDNEFGYLVNFAELSDEPTNLVYKEYFSALIAAWEQGRFGYESSKLSDEDFYLGQDQESLSLEDIDPSNPSRLLFLTKTKLFFVDIKKNIIENLPKNNPSYGSILSAAFVNTPLSKDSSYLLVSYEKGSFLLPTDQGKLSSMTPEQKLSSKSFDTLVRFEDPFGRKGHGGLLLLQSNKQESSRFNDPSVSFFSERQLKVAWSYKLDQGSSEVGKLKSIVLTPNWSMIGYENMVLSVSPFTEKIKSLSLAEVKPREDAATLTDLLIHPSDYGMFSIALSNCGIINLAINSFELLDYTDLQQTAECSSAILSSDGKFILQSNRSGKTIPIIRSPLQELLTTGDFTQIKQLDVLGGSSDKVAYLKQDGSLGVFDVGTQKLLFRAHIDCRYQSTSGSTDQTSYEETICADNEVVMKDVSSAGLYTNPWDNNHFLVQNAQTLQVWDIAKNQYKSLKLNGFSDKDEITFFAHPTDPHIFYAISDGGILAKIDFWIGAQEIFGERREIATPTDQP